MVEFQGKLIRITREEHHENLVRPTYWDQASGLKPTTIACRGAHLLIIRGWALYIFKTQALIYSPFLDLLKLIPFPNPLFYCLQPARNYVAI